MGLAARCWYCSEEIGSAERAKVVGDLNVRVHVGCFERLYETESVKPWSTPRRSGEAPKPPPDDEDEDSRTS